jgi:hypothetical protein
VWRIEEFGGDNLINHNKGQRNNQPHENPAGPFAHIVQAFGESRKLHWKTSFVIKKMLKSGLKYKKGL